MRECREQTKIFLLDNSKFSLNYVLLFRREEKRAKIEANRRLKQIHLQDNIQNHRRSSELPVSYSSHIQMTSKNLFFSRLISMISSKIYLHFFHNPISLI